MLLKKLISLDLSYQIILGLVTGLFVGLFFGELTLHIQWIGDVWIRLMQMAVIPYVTLSLISGVGSLNVTLARSLAVRGGLLLLLFWAISAVILVAMPLTFPDRVDASFLSHHQVSNIDSLNPIDLYIPYNPFHSLANTIVPAVVLFSIILGIALIRIENKNVLISSLSVLTEALIRVMKFMIKLTPIGIFSIVSVAAGTMTLDQLVGLQVYFIVYIIASIVLTFGVVPLIITMLTPFSYRDIMYYSRDALLTAFITQNSLIVLPLLIKRSMDLFEKYEMQSEENRHIVDVILPVTYNFPLCGKLLSLLFIPFTAWMSGNDLSLSEYPMLIFSGIFSMFAKSDVAVSFLMDSYHIPHDLFHLYIPSTIINGRFDTMAGVMTLFAFSLIVTVALRGQLKLVPLRITKGLAGAGVSLAASILAAHLFMSEFINLEYNKDRMLLNMQTSSNSENGIVVIHNEPPQTARVMPAEGGGRLLDVIRKSGVLRVGYRKERVPLSFYNSHGELVGLDVELIKSLAYDLNLRVEFYPFEWDNFKQLLNDYYLDIVPSVAFDTFNMLYINTTKPYLVGRLGFIMRDYRRHDYTTLEKINTLGVLKLAILGEPTFVDNMSRKIKAVLPDLDIQVTRISHYDEFFKLGDAVDALFEVDEIGTGLTLLNPEYSIVIPDDSQFAYPMAYAVPSGEMELNRFLSQWIEVQQAHGVTTRLSDYWIYGKGAIRDRKRWSIMRDVLGW